MTLQGLFRAGKAVSLVGIGLVAGAAQGAPKDPAPLPPQAVQTLIGGGEGSALPRVLRRYLDESGKLVRGIATAGKGGAAESVRASKRGQLAANLNELEAARAEMRTEFAATRQKLASLGLTAKVREWDALSAKAEGRFDRVETALRAVAAARGQAALARVVAAAEGVLKASRRPAQAEPALSGGPMPTFRQDAPLPFKPQPASHSLPRYLSQHHAAPDNVYAFLGNTLLAALPPPTPAGAAATCSYTAADLADDGHEVQLTQEIKDLAASLGYSPVKIFKYVADNIRYQPYYGSLKGALGTLYAGAGNETDQASLLIALLRASNVPARYVRGSIQILDSTPLGADGRAPRWLGAKSYLAAANILAQGRNPAVGLVTNGSGQAIGIGAAHVWVEACVPYSHYRGAASDVTGSRWIPMDPSFKDATYQAGIATNVDFDYAGYLAHRGNTLPVEAYETQVEAAIQSLPPNYGNNTLQDVPYAGTAKPLSLDILPASLPYEVSAFTDWSNSGTPETASLPDDHRYHFNITVADAAGANLAAPLSLAMPDVILKRVTLSFVGATGADQAALAAWQGDNNPDSAIPCTVNVVPDVKVDGVDQNLALTAGASVGLCTGPATGDANHLTLEVSLPELGSYASVNKVGYTNIGAANYHALEAYGFHASDRLLAERVHRLVTTVDASADPNGNPEETEGEFLHIVGLKYMRHLTDAAKTLGGLDGGSGESGNHLGLVSSQMKVEYLFDLPFAVYRQGFLVDMPGGLSRDVDLSTGANVWKTFLLSGYAGSAYESYVWQENAGLDAVSTVRGMQFANESGIPVLQITSANWSSQSPLLTSNADPTLNYSSSLVSQLQTQYINNGYTLNIPRSLIRYNNWTGAVFEAEKNDTANNQMHAGFIISGGYAGGYTTGLPVEQTGFSAGLDAGSYSLDPALPYPNNNLGFANGNTAGTTTQGDPVNMATGNLYHVERDITVKGRGNLPIVFERSYNSRAPQDGPLGFGWTHTFNQYLSFKDDNANGAADAADTDGLTSSVGWTDGTGAERVFQVAGSAAGVAVGSTFTDLPGTYVQVSRNGDGRYAVREKNGLTYTFESVAGTVGQRARLVSIRDRNGNALSLSYDGANLAAVSDGLNRQLTFSYNGNHISQIQDWTGRQFQYTYDADGNLAAFKNPLAVSGAQDPVSYQYYSAADGPSLAHALKRYTLPRGNGMRFEYYANGKVFRHTDPQGGTNTFSYNDFRRESSVVNERGQTRRFFFDANGNPLKIVEENGAEHSYGYDNWFNRTAKTDPEGNLTQYAYDALGNLIQITQPSGATVAFGNFTAYNQPGKIKDANGNYTLLQYDAHGNLVNRLAMKAGVGAAIDPAGYTPAASDLVAWTARGYDGYGNLVSVQRMRDLAAQSGPEITYGYDAQGLNAVTVTRNGNRNGGAVSDSASQSYDALGRLTAGITPDWYPSRFAYDAVDRVVSASDILGNRHSYRFDANGNPTGEDTVADNGGAQQVDSAAASYDSNDRKTSSVDAGGFVTSYQYDPAGNLIQITNPDNYSLGFQYDPANRWIKAFDQEGHAVSRSLDPEGKPRSVTDPNGNTTRYVYYDASQNGRLKQTVDPLGRATGYGYDANGNLTSVTDNAGNVTLTDYDELNRPVRVVGPVYDDPTLGTIRPVTVYHYDPLGNRTRVAAGYTDASGTNPAADVTTVQQTAAYDDFGDRLSETDALGRTWSASYDRHGDVLTATDPKGQQTRYAWGSGHQLLSRTDAAGNQTVTSRNPLGQPLQVQSPAVGYNYAYDAAHRLIRLTDSRGGKRLDYAWSPGGLLDRMTDADGNETDYLYDPVGRLTGIWAPNYDYVAFAYDAGGRLVEKWFPNGVDAQYAWNPDNTLASLSNTLGGSVVSSHVYSYDTLGNRATDTETVNGTPIAYAYAYDALNRLIQVSTGDPAQQENYGYDPLGNRTGKTVNATAPVTTAYVYDAANQLTEIHSGSPSGPLLASLGYDPDGNLTGRSDTGLSLTYDALNRLVQASAGGQVSNYAYDDQGRRIQKTVAGATVNYLYSGPDIVAEYGANWGAPAAQYTHGPNSDDPLIRATATAAQYFHQDGINSVVAVTDNLGAVDATQRFDAWGNKVASTGTPPHYGYTGREPDETGLIYYRARYYDPSIGRFTQRDPIGLAGGGNLYAYVGNNPVNLIDPMGLLGADPVQLADTGGLQAYWGVVTDWASQKATNVGQSLRNVVQYGYYKTDAEMEAWGVGLQRAQQAGPEAVANYLHGDLPGKWMEDVAAIAVMGGAPTMGRAAAEKVVTKSADETVDVYRVFGGDARAQGFSWTTKDPRTVSNFRDAAGLPSGGASGATNTADFLIKGEAKAADIIKSRSALPLDGNKGGLPELIIDPKNVNITDFSVLKP